MKKTIATLLVILFIMIFPCPSHAEDIAVTTWSTEGVVLQNGDVTFSEKITYSFDKNFNGIFRTLPTKGTDGIEGIQVYHGDHDLPLTHVETAKNGDVGVYTTKTTKHGIELKIYQPVKSGETALYRIDYTATNAILVHSDVLELSWHFVDKTNETPIVHYTFDFILPEPDANIAGFYHGKPLGEVAVEKERVHLIVKDIAPETPVGLRVLFPKAFAPLASRQGNSSQQELLAWEAKEAQRLISEGERIQRLEHINRTIAPFSLLAVLGAFFLGRNRKMEALYPGVYVDLSYGEAAQLAHDQVDYRAINATLFSLVENDVLAIANHGDEKTADVVFTVNKGESVEMTRQEHMIYDLFMNHLGDGSTLRYHDIQSIIDTQEGYMTFQESYNAYSTEVRRSLKSKGIGIKLGRMILAIVLFVLWLIFGLFSLIIGAEAGGWGIGIGIAGTIYSVVLGLFQNEKGKAYKNELKTLKKDLEAGAEVDLPQGSAMLYAIALGVDKSQTTFSSEDDFMAYSGSWLLYYLILANNRQTMAYNSSYGGSLDSPSSGASFTGSAGGGGTGGF